MEKNNIIREEEKPQNKKEEEKVKYVKNPTNYLLGISSFLLLITTIGLTGSLFLYNGSIAWIGATFTFLILTIIFVFLLVVLGKKTHALMELNAIITGKPISLFFTDHKKLEWRVVEPEGNILSDKKYGSFLINEKGAYVDSKTKNIFMAFNPTVASNAAVECYKISDTLNKVLLDEKKLSMLRYNLMNSKTVDNRLIYYNQNGEEVELSDFNILKENVNFSHLKSLLNTLIPHSITSKIEMTVQQRMSGFGKVNMAQIILIIVSIVGAVTLAIMLLNMYGGGGTETIVKEVGKTVVNNSSAIKG